MVPLGLNGLIGNFILGIQVVNTVWLVLYDALLVLTLKHRETHGCVVSTVATDALVLKHQAISILSTD